MLRILTAVLAIASGIIVLLGYFFKPLAFLRFMLVDWAIVIAGMAVLVGIANLVAVQMEKIRTRQKGGVYGALLIVSLAVTFFGIGIWVGPQSPSMLFAVNAIVVPVEASLMAILAITLIYASIRLLRRRVDVMSVLFLIATLLFLFFTMPTPIGPVPGDRAAINFLGLFSQSGARGLLIGIALGTLLTGLRILFGVDRPYGGN